MKTLEVKVWSGRMWLDADDAMIRAIDRDSTVITLRPTGSILSAPPEIVLCSGRLDKNERKIWIGDIVCVKLEWRTGHAMNGTDEDHEEDHYGVVRFTPYRGFHMEPIYAVDVHTAKPVKPRRCNMAKARTLVMGNIFENPKLLNYLKDGNL